MKINNNNNNYNASYLMNVNNTHQILQDTLIEHFQRAEPQSPPAQSNIFNIYWQIPFETKFGESIAIVGNKKELGNWKTEEALKLHWSENNIWRGFAMIDLNQEYNEKQILEYKYILLDETQKTVQWEEGQNRFYYYSQIHKEAFPQLSCSCPITEQENQERTGFNSVNRQFQQQIDSFSNSNSQCCHELFLEDIWNKKSIIFRIKDSDYNCKKISKDKKSQQISTSSLKSPLFSNCSLSSEKLDQNQTDSTLNLSEENLKEDQQSRQISYLITGNHKALGGLRHPQMMNYDPLLKCWEFKAEVDRNTEYIRYFYIKKDDSNHFSWEKGSGRFIYMQPLNNLCSFKASAVNFCPSSEFQSSHSLSDTNFVALKNEIISSPILRPAQTPSHNSSNPSSQNKLNYQNLNCTCCYPMEQVEKASKKMSGKMQVNPLKRGIFISENKEDNLDFSLSFDNISEKLFVGPYVSNNESEILQLKQQGIDTVLSLQTDEDMLRRQVDKAHLKELYRNLGIEYYNIPIKDKSYKDFFMKSHEAVDKLYNLLRNPKRTVYLHCTGGISRAPQTAILYLSLYKNFPLKKAIRFVCNKRESAFPDEELLHQVYNKSIDNIMNYSQYMDISN